MLVTSILFPPHKNPMKDEVSVLSDVCRLQILQIWTKVKLCRLVKGYTMPRLKISLPTHICYDDACVCNLYDNCIRDTVNPSQIKTPKQPKSGHGGNYSCTDFKIRSKISYS